MGITRPTKEYTGHSLIPIEVKTCDVYAGRVESDAATGVRRVFLTVDPRQVVLDDHGVSYLTLDENADTAYARALHKGREEATAAVAPEEGQMSKEDLLATQARLWQEEARRYAASVDFWREQTKGARETLEGLRRRVGELDRWAADQIGFVATDEGGFGEPVSLAESAGLGWATNVYPAEGVAPKDDGASLRHFEPDGTPRELTPATLAALRPFEYSHLPGRMRETSKLFSDLAHQLVADLAEGPELTLALRELRRAKDSAVMQAFITAESS